MPVPVAPPVLPRSSLAEQLSLGRSAPTVVISESWAHVGGSVCNKPVLRVHTVLQSCLQPLLEELAEVSARVHLPFVMPKSVLTTRTSLHSSLCPGNSLRSPCSSSSVDSSESSSVLRVLCGACEMGLPPKSPRDFAWPMKYPVTPAIKAHAIAIDAVVGGGCSVIFVVCWRGCVRCLARVVLQ